MIARTRKGVQNNPSPLLNIHHDRNNTEDESRVVTFMVYLTTVDAGHGGETFFPALGADLPTDIIAQGLQLEYEEGGRILHVGSDLLVACEKRLLEWRGERASDHYVGIGTKCTAGTALMFDARGDGSSFGSWHAPCRVSGLEEKWIVTFFKSPPPRWSCTILGL
jgi:hypothetical protein